MPRQTPKEAFPGFDVLKLYKALGGEILTIGSDAHIAEDVGKGLKEAVGMARAAGFRYITVFNRRKPGWVSITEEENTFGKASSQRMIKPPKVFFYAHSEFDFMIQKELTGIAFNLSKYFRDS